MIGEFASNVIFVNAVYLFNKSFQWHYLFINILWEIINTITFYCILYYFIIDTKKGKVLTERHIIFSTPLFLWLVLVSNKYEAGNVMVISGLLSVVLNHQSSGIENLSGVSEVPNWNNFEIFRVFVIPLIFMYLVNNNKEKINNIFGMISFPLIVSTLSIYLWFWLLSPTKWIRYSQHFTILVIISMIYFVGFKLIDSKLDLFIIYSSISTFIGNFRNIIFIFILLSAYTLFVQKRIQ